MICVLERVGLRSRQAERIYQNRTRCNRLSLCLTGGPAAKSETRGGAAAGAKSAGLPAQKNKIGLGLGFIL